MQCGPAGSDGAPTATTSTTSSINSRGGSPSCPTSPLGSASTGYHSRTLRGKRPCSTNAESAAHAHGLDAASVRALFALQIEQAKAVETRATIGPATLDLEREIRPALSQIGEHIVERLAALAPLDPSRLSDERLVPLGELLGPGEIAELRDALVAVRKGSP